MKQINFVLFSLLSLPLLAAADASSNVRNTSDSLDEAILAGDGEAAFALLSTESQKTIENTRDLAINADKATLMQQPIPIILSVFSIRTEAQGNPPANGPETLILMSTDYAKTSSIADIGDVTVNGDKASAVMLVNGNPSPMNFSFIKENGSWKVDMAQQLKDTEEMMMESLPAGMSQEMIVNQMASASSSDGVDVWKPLK